MSKNMKNSNALEEGYKFFASFAAGLNGYYEYDAKTNKARYVAPESSQAEAQSIFTGLSDEEAATPDGSMPRGGTYQAVPNPAGVQLSTCLLGARFAGADGTLDGMEAGTGWLINNTYLVTAGHILYKAKYKNNGNGGYAKHVAVFVGASNGTSKEYKVGHWHAVGGDYVNHCETKDDYFARGMFDDWGVVKLDSPLSVTVPKLSLRSVNGMADMRNRTYTTQGYPAKYGVNASRGWSKWQMYQSSGTIYQELGNPDTLSGPEARYIAVVDSDNIAVQGGQSGSPLYTTRYSYQYGEGIAVAAIGDYSVFVYVNSWLYNYLKGLL